MQTIEVKEEEEVTRFMFTAADVKKMISSIIKNTSSIEWKSVRPYMRKLVTDAHTRIMRYHNNPGMLSFGHNETIMIFRLYRRL